MLYQTTQAIIKNVSCDKRKKYILPFPFTIASSIWVIYIFSIYRKINSLFTYSFAIVSFHKHFKIIL